MNKFANIQAMAEKRKGGALALKELLPPIISSENLAQKGDDRFLSMMTRCVFQAGFNWSVITKKWPGFEEAFYNFDINKLSNLTIDEWDAYFKDKRIVRNGQKIKSLMENTKFVEDIAKEHGSFARFIANWPEDDLVNLWLFLKKHGNRLGGNTGQYFLRFVGKDAFILSKDVVTALQHANIDISDRPNSKRDLKLAQDAFNNWHQQTGLSYTNLSRILAYSIGKNYENEEIKTQQQKYS